MTECELRKEQGSAAVHLYPLSASAENQRELFDAIFQQANVIMYNVRSNLKVLLQFPVTRGINQKAEPGFITVETNT